MLPRENERKETTMKKMSDNIIKKSPYNTTYKAIYTSNHNITTNEAEDLMNKHYRMFPITKSTYALNGKNITITYILDNCD